MGTLWARNFGAKSGDQSKWATNWEFLVVGTGVDPVTSRFSVRTMENKAGGSGSSSLLSIRLERVPAAVPLVLTSHDQPVTVRTQQGATART